MKRDESQNVEYKESWQDKYLEWVCGYANAKGGTLYIGIEDGTKKPVGVKNPNKLMEDIPNSIRNTMGIVADVSLLKKQGKDVIRIKVIVVDMINVGISSGKPLCSSDDFGSDTNIISGHHNKRNFSFWCRARHRRNRP